MHNLIFIIDLLLKMNMCVTELKSNIIFKHFFSVFYFLKFLDESTLNTNSECFCIEFFNRILSNSGNKAKSNYFLSTGFFLGFNHM